MSSPILVSPGTRFTCVPCGFCCGFWDINIDKQRRDSLEQKGWVKGLAREFKEDQHKPLFRILGQGEQALIQRRHGVCSLMDDRMLCAVHAAEGFKAKPLVCQQYPNIYYESPRGIEVFLDYSCPEVIRNTGELVTAETVAGTLPGEYVQKANSTFPLNPRTMLDWDGYLCLEQAFLRILDKSLDFEDKILQLDRLVRDLGQRLKDVPALSPNSLGELLPEVEAAAGLRSSKNSEQPSSNPSKGDLYLAILVQWVESSFSGEVTGKAVGSAAVIRNILAQWRGIGEHTFEVFKFRVNYKDMRSIAFEPRSDELREPLGRYLEYQVRMLVGTGKIPITRRLGIIATNFALVKWFSRAHAASIREPEVSVDDVVFGIKVVEKFLSNRLFNKLSEKKSFLSNYINLLFDNPSLPNTMLSRP